MNNFGALIGLVCIFIAYTALADSLREDVYPMYEESEDEEDDSSEVIAVRSGRDDEEEDSKARKCNQDVVNYINKRIVTTLEENKKVTDTELAIDTLYNKEREKLAKAFIPAAGKVSKCKKAEQDLRKFNDFAAKYKDIRMKVWSALDELKKISVDPDYSSSSRNEALKLSLSLKQVDSLTIAAETLADYEKFLKKRKTSNIQAITMDTEPINLKQTLTTLLQRLTNCPLGISPDNILPNDIKALIFSINELVNKPSKGKEKKKKSEFEYAEYYADAINSLL